MQFREVFLKTGGIIAHFNIDEYGLVAVKLGIWRMGMERDTEGVGKEMGQVQPVYAPSGLGYVAAAAMLVTDKYFQDCYRMDFTEKHLEKR